jgi:hypothetical protein
MDELKLLRSTASLLIDRWHREARRFAPLLADRVHWQGACILHLASVSGHILGVPFWEVLQATLKKYEKL